MIKLNELQHNRVVSVIDNAQRSNFVSDESSVSHSDIWDRFYKKPFGNEREGFSEYVSSIVLRNTVQLRAYVTAPYNNAKGHIFKLSDEKASLYLNHVFDKIIGGRRKFRDLSFNQILLGAAIADTHLKAHKPIPKVVVFDGPSQDDVDTQFALFKSEVKPYEVVDTEDTSMDGVFAKKVVYLEKGVEYHPNIRVIAPEVFFVSDDAEELDDAAVIGGYYLSTISELKYDFPDAHKYNNQKKSDFWENLSNDFNNWLGVEADASRWFNSTLADRSHTSKSDVGLGGTKVLVSKAQIKVDLDDKGYCAIYEVYKVGNKILSCTMINQRTLCFASLIDIANKWKGLSVGEMLLNEELSATLQYRMVEDGLIQSQHPNPVVDEDQLDSIDDILNRTPDSIIRRKSNDFTRTNSSPIETFKMPDPSPLGLQMRDKMEEDASLLTGAGKFFQPFQPDNQTFTNISAETAQIVENNSNLLLDDFTNVFAELAKKVGMQLYNLGRAGGAPVTVESKDGLVLIDPSELPELTECTLDVTPSATERDKKRTNALQRYRIMAEILGPQTQIPAIAARLSPKLLDDVIVDLLESLEVQNPRQYLDVEADNANVENAIMQARHEGVAEGQAMEQQSASRQLAMKQLEEIDSKIAKNNADAESTIERTAAEIANMSAQNKFEGTRIEQNWKRIENESRDVDIREESLASDIAERIRKKARGEDD